MTIPSIINESAQSISVSTSAAVTTTPLQPGIYALWSTTDTYIKLNETSTVADDVTVSTGYKIQASSSPAGIKVTEPAFLAAIAGENGTLYYHKV